MPESDSCRILHDLACILTFLIPNLYTSHGFLFGNHRHGAVWFPSAARHASSSSFFRHNNNFQNYNYAKPSSSEEACEDNYGYPGICISKGECMERQQMDYTSTGMDPGRRPRICGWKFLYFGFRRPLVCCVLQSGTELYSETRDLPVSGEESISGNEVENVVTSATAAMDDSKLPAATQDALAPLQDIARGIEECGCVRKPENEVCPIRTSPPGPKIITFVVGGLPAVTPGDYPWMVALGERQGDSIDWFCGGSLISDRHVLTAAHCFDNSRVVDVVRLGEYDLTVSDEALTVDVGAEKIIKHEGYKEPEFYNDIALIKLNATVKFTNNIRSICLPMARVEEVPTDLPLIVMGWGTVGFGGTMSGTLQFVGVPLVNREQCNDSYKKLAPAAIAQKYPNGITMDIVCAGSAGKDACQGDSGGPLVQEGTNEDTGEDLYTIVGVVSSGIRCGDGNFPGLYTRVDRYLDWIKGAMMS